MITDSESSDSKTVTVIIPVVVLILDNTVLDGEKRFMLNMSVSPEVPTAGQTPSEVAVIGDTAVTMVTIGDNENTGEHCINDPRHEKICFLHMQKQRHRSAVWLPHS